MSKPPGSSPVSRGVYLITCRATGKRYVGSSENIEKRLYNHASQLNYGDHPNPHLQNAWRKHGEAAFKFEVLELVAGDLEAEEQRWIDHLRPEFNVIRAGAPPMRGRKHSAESIAKMRGSWTPERRAVHTAKCKGRPKPLEQRLRLSQSIAAKKALAWLNKLS